MGDHPILIDPSTLERMVRERVEAVLAETLEAKLEEMRRAKTPSMTIIATKGTLDWAYPPFILASTAAALGWEVAVFFTFYGLELLRKDLSGLRVSPLGNPAMPMKMPFGPDWLRSLRWSMPSLIEAMPGFEAFATRMMKKTMRGKGVAQIAELRSAAVEAGVALIGCQMTVDLFGYSRDDFVAEVKDYVGAAAFLPMARDADVSLFI